MLVKRQELSEQMLQRYFIFILYFSAYFQINSVQIFDFGDCLGLIRGKAKIAKWLQIYWFEEIFAF